jgi:hypothetical protein
MVGHAPLIWCLLLVLATVVAVRADGLGPPGGGFSAESGIFSTDPKQRFNSYMQLVGADKIEGHTDAARRHSILANDLAQQHNWQVPFPSVAEPAFRGDPGSDRFSDGLAPMAKGGPPTPSPGSELKTYVQLAKVHRLEGHVEKAAREEIFANDIAVANHEALPFPKAGTSEAIATESHGDHHLYHHPSEQATHQDDDGKGKASYIL